MTRIAYVISEYPAPSHTFIRREISALRRSGVIIDVFSIRATEPSNDGPLDAAERESTAVVQRQPLSAIIAGGVLEILRHPAASARLFGLAMQHRVPGFKPLIWAIFHLVEALVLGRLLRKAGATHVHSHFANSGSTIALLAARSVGLPWSFTIHGISETDYPAGVLLPAKVRQAEFVACASWFIRAQALRTVDPSQWEKTFIVRCGVELDRLPTPPARAADAPVTLICVGRLSSEKGHAGLLDAFARLVEDDASLRLVMVGDGPEFPRLTEQVARLGISDHVQFTGRLDETRTLESIARSDVLVLPSLMEGLPVVLMEALGLGKPVVTSWVAGVPELVTQGQNGLLFPPGNWDALHAALEEICKSRALRDRLSSKARQCVEAEFAIETAVHSLAVRFRGA